MPIEMTGPARQTSAVDAALATAPVPGPRNVWTAMSRGLKCRCPNCGQGRMFRAYLKVADACPACREELHHHRADDAPAYVTISIVGHVVVGGLLVMEQALAPPTWVQLAIWLPAGLLLSLLLLPVAKGALVGLQWANRMHGFGGKPDEPEPEPLPDNHPAATSQGFSRP